MSKGSSARSTVPRSSRICTKPSSVGMAPARERDDRVGRDRTAREHEIRRRDEPVAIRGTRRRASVSLRRFSTMPRPPSSPCSSMSTTVRSKFGSTRGGAATSRLSAERSAARARLDLGTRRPSRPGRSIDRDERVVRICSRRCATTVGAAHVRTDPDVDRRECRRLDRSVPRRDRRGRAARAPSTRSPACSQLCDAAGVAVVPQGGNTGLVGGSVPLAR